MGRFALEVYWARSILNYQSMALEVLKRNSFELVTSDIKMEGIDGLHLLSEIFEIDPRLDTIMMSGHTSVYTYGDIIKAVADDSIAKPF